MAEYFGVVLRPIGLEIKNDSKKLKTVIFLQSVLRRYIARKKVQLVRERGYGQEIAAAFLLQQLENSSDDIYNSQLTAIMHRRVEKRASVQSDKTSTIEQESKGQGSSEDEEQEEEEEEEQQQQQQQQQQQDEDDYF